MRTSIITVFALVLATAQAAILSAFNSNHSNDHLAGAIKYHHPHPPNSTTTHHSSYSPTTTPTTTISTSTVTTTTQTQTQTTTTTTGQPTETPGTNYTMKCAVSISDLCGDVCFCSQGSMNCHADPSARCYQMCQCVPASQR